MYEPTDFLGKTGIFAAWPDVGLRWNPFTVILMYLFVKCSLKVNHQWRLLTFWLFSGWVC